jgi:SAM-dependent MidA family methyltransferase
MGDALLEELAERIRSAGPIPFATYMERALYHPHHGYYAAHVPGNGVHYTTSASLTPWFGRLVARELGRMWQALGQPDPFTVVEVGGGLAVLAAEAMEVEGPLAEALRWRFVEQFAEVKDLQRRRLGWAAGRASWVSGLDQGAPVVGCVLVNEVLDNFPVHLLEVSGAGVQEVYVDLEDDRLVERPGPLSSEALAHQAREAAAHLGDGDRFEVCLGVEAWCREAYGALERGYLLVIDYGDLEPGIWSRGPPGTLTTYGPSYLGPEPLEHPGAKDITADVNFSALVRAAREAGFTPDRLTHQRDWLLSLGLDAVAADLTGAAEEAVSWGWYEDAEVILGERDHVLALADGDGLGNLLVFRASKGVEPRRP